MVTRSLLARLGRLETEITAKGRGLIIVLDNAKSDEEIADALRQRGIDPDEKSNLILNMKRIGEAADWPFRFLYARPMAKGSHR